MLDITEILGLHFDDVVHYEVGLHVVVGSAAAGGFGLVLYGGAAAVGPAPAAGVTGKTRRSRIGVSYIKISFAQVALPMVVAWHFI